MADSPALRLREFSLEPADKERLDNLCGPLDENLRLIESRLAVEVRRRGASFRIQGDRATAAESLLRELFRLTRTEDVTPETVHLALRDHDPAAGAPSRAKSVPSKVHTAQDDLAHAGIAVAAAGGGEAAADVKDAAEGDDTEDETENGLRTLRGTIRARGANQREYLRRIRRNDLTFGVGPAGTGKTYLAVACAVEALQADRVRRIVLVRPAVEAGERLGFLPGDLTQKVDPYLRPMYDALYEMMGFDRVAKLIERNVIEVAPLAFMRGRSLNDSFIILDEAQNTTVEQMKMFLTRIGFGSRAVVTGDVTQTDLPAGKTSGLRHVLEVLQHVPGVAFQFFEARDVVRHPLVQRIVQAYEARETHSP